jgi:GT2 family glycosyltransferase
VVDGVNGLLVPPGDVGAMRQALGRLVEDPALLGRLRDGAAASTVRTLEDDAEATERLYESLVRPLPGTERLAAVVLHYGHPDETRLAVRSLLASRRSVDDLIVVDNDPERRCAAAIDDVRDRVVYLESPRNLGFSGGMNLGIREALARGASRVFLANNDVIVPPDTIGRLERALLSEPALAAVGPVVLSRTDPNRVATRGMSYNPRTGRMRQTGYGQRADKVSREDSVPHVVDGISGCAMLVSRAAIGAAGFLDEAYFFGFEDLDWCLRARRAGLSSAVVLDARAYHEGARAIGSDSSSRFYFAARNHLRLAKSGRARAEPLGAPFRTLAIVALNFAHACRPAPGPLSGRLGAVVRGTRDYFAGRYGPQEHTVTRASSRPSDLEPS